MICFGCLRGIKFVSFVDVKKFAYLLHIVIFSLALFLVVSQICCISGLENNKYFSNEAGKQYLFLGRKARKKYEKSRKRRILKLNVGGYLKVKFSSYFWLGYEPSGDPRVKIELMEMVNIEWARLFPQKWPKVGFRKFHRANTGAFQ